LPVSRATSGCITRKSGSNWSLADPTVPSRHLLTQRDPA
jgi:hypothetical protein